ncbi:MAG: methyltransferase [Nitrospinota bacterium]
MTLERMQREESPERLLEPGSFWATRLVLAAVKLDLFSRLDGAARSVESLARELGLHPRGLALFLDALASLGLLRKEGESYQNEPIAAQQLVRGREGFAGHQLLLDEEDWGRWVHLEEALRLGGSPFGDDPLYGEAGRLRNLLLGLHRDAQGIAPALARRLELEGCRRLLDLGGGAGSYSVAFCREHPELRSWLLDLPAAIEVAREVVGRSEVADRVEFIAADFCRDPIPGRYDVVFASNILHARGEEENRSLLRRVRGVLEEGGRLIVREPFLREDGAAPPWAAVFSVYLLLHTRAGRCYRTREVAGWLEEVGFREVRELDPLELLQARA